VGRREKKNELTRSIILDAAAELFAKKGYQATSVEDIVQSASMVKGTFYYHFRSKDDIVYELRKQTLLQDFESIHTALNAGASPIRVIVELFARDAAWTENNIEMAQVFFSQLFGGFLKTAPQLEITTEQEVSPPLIMIIEAAQKAGELRSDIAADELADMLMGILGHAQFSWLIGPKESSLVERVRNWMHFVLQGLAAGSENSNSAPSTVCVQKAAPK